MKTEFLIITGIVLIAVFGFGIFFTFNYTDISESFLDNNKRSEYSESSKIPLYDGSSSPVEIPPHYGSAPVEIPPHYNSAIENSDL